MSGAHFNSDGHHSGKEKALGMRQLKLNTMRGKRPFYVITENLGHACVMLFHKKVDGFSWKIDFHAFGDEQFHGNDFLPHRHFRC